MKNLMGLVLTGLMATPILHAQAEWAADRLGLPLEIREVGDTGLEHALEQLLQEA